MAERWADVIEGWKTDASARLQLIERLRAAPEPALLWETSPSLTGDEDYEEVIAPKPALLRRAASVGPFRPFLTDQVVCFPNLGGDTLLVAPPDIGADFGHLKSFSMNAPLPLQHQLWQRVAVEVQRWWADPHYGVLWLSTHGTGVPWLHVRLDPRPKYYQSRLRRLGPAGTRPAVLP